MASCIAREPVFNKSQKVFGYKLQYREDPDALPADIEDVEVTSSQTIIHAFHDIGIQKVTGGKRAFVSFTENYLYEQVATLLPNKILVVELREDIEPTPEVLDMCRLLHHRGYTIAIDNFDLKAPSFPLLEIADIINLNFSTLQLNQISIFAQNVKDRDFKLLAKEIETNEQFQNAKKLGFALFHGNFFSRPADDVPAEIALSPLKTNCLQLIRLALDPTANYTKVANIVKRDVALSYKLLRVVNSAFFGLKYSVRNIKQALAILGMDDLKKWITLISMTQMTDNKPDELVSMSLIRARFLELIAPSAGMARDTEELFMLGLMSMMDAITDAPFTEIIRLTNVSHDIAESLLTHRGKYGQLLEMIIHYDHGEWDECFSIASDYNLSDEQVVNAYLDAIEWSSQLQ